MPASQKMDQNRRHSVPPSPTPFIQWNEKQLDDVVGAAPVHLFGGMWGLVAAGLFSSRFGYAAAYYDDRSEECAGLLYGGDGRSLAANVVFLLAVVAWVGLLSLVMFITIKLTIGIRVSKAQEMAGMCVFSPYSVRVIVCVFFGAFFCTECWSHDAVVDVGDVGQVGVPHCAVAIFQHREIIYLSDESDKGILPPRSTLDTKQDNDGW